MTQTTTAQQPTPTHPTTSPRTDHTMSPHRSPLTRALTCTAYFLGLLLLVALWTVYGPSYDAQATPLPTTSDTPATTSDPCPAGEATGGTCGTEGPVNAPDASTPTDTSPSDSASPQTQRRCRGCRLTQEEYDARQADKQAAHDRAEARRQRGAERRAEAQRKREERAARKASRSSSSSHTSSHHSTGSKASESSSEGLPAQDSTSTQDDSSQTAQDAPEASTDASAADTSDSSDAPADSAPHAPLEIPEASRRPAPYDASKDPFEVRREAARQAADAVNHTATSRSTSSSDQVKTPSTTPAPTSSDGSWAEQVPTWALCLIGFLAASGLIVYKVSRPRSRLSDHSDLLGDRRG